MILIGLGANLPTAQYGPPDAGLRAALARLLERGLRVIRVSRFYRSAPLPPSDQPWYINAVAVVESALAPQALMAGLLALEASFGRRREERWAARTLDLDLLDYDGQVVDLPESDQGPALRLPHERLQERAFVLRPLQDVAPDWHHPASGAAIGALLKRLPASQQALPISGGDPETS
jgi:2-amino-4-hydroxy-6-hydroxymethyldihydropteridine diphosphokinase